MIDFIVKNLFLGIKTKYYPSVSCYNNQTIVNFIRSRKSENKKWDTNHVFRVKKSFLFFIISVIFHPINVRNFIS